MKLAELPVLGQSIQPVPSVEEESEATTELEPNPEMPEEATP